LPLFSEDEQQPMVAYGSFLGKFAQSPPVCRAIIRSSSVLVTVVQATERIIRKNNTA
jgi:hypothetical protein